MLRVVARGGDAGRVGAVGLEAQVLLEEERAGAESPMRRRLEVAPGLDALAVAFHLVAEHEGGARALDTAQMVVLAVEAGDGIGQARGRLRAVAELEDLGDLGAEVRPAGEQKRRLRRSEEIAIQARGRAHRARDSGPDELLLIRLPRQTRGG